MTHAEIYPFAEVGDTPGQRYPDWLRELDGANGVYLIRARETGELAYIGESHSDRRYGTLTRHFQRWSPKWDTAVATYHRRDVEVAVIRVPSTHAMHLQNELICAFDPPDNRLVCDELYETDEDDEGLERPPRSYRYDIAEIVGALFDEDPDVPF